MNTENSFELARPEDAAAIFTIFRDTFEPHLLTCVPLGCSGAISSIEDTVRCPLENLDNAWIVARNSNVRGFIQARLTMDTIFINYVHVDPAAQGQGIGRGLLIAVLDRFELGRDTISLDVAETNTRAKDWYERLGFKEQYVSIWKQFPLDDGQITADYLISGIPQADRLHKTYGCSMLTVKTKDGSFDVGRCGDKYFRTSDPNLITNPILRAIDPKRELVVTSDKVLPGGREISRRLRMTASIANVRERLIGTTSSVNYHRRSDSDTPVHSLRA